MENRGWRRGGIEEARIPSYLPRPRRGCPSLAQSLFVPGPGRSANASYVCRSDREPIHDDVPHEAGRIIIGMLHVGIDRGTRYRASFR